MLPLICLVGGLVPVRLAFGQTMPDSTTAKAQIDSLDGIKFFKAGRMVPVGRLSTVPKGRLYMVNPNAIQITTSWDSVSTYQIHQTLLGYETFFPTVVDFETYRLLKKEQQKTQLRNTLIQVSKAQQEDRRGLLDFSIQVPGGENSAFSTIFGTNEVNLRVNGSANMTVGATVQKSDDASLPPDLRTRVDPTFNQNLQLNIQGTIGDKLTIATDWDTERQFDFENRLSIVYQGYEDEIIKSIEMGNVSMATGNSLVSGGSSLFGIKAVSELGPLKVTTVVSQQKGKSNSQTISGGSREVEISLRPADYEDGRHFFLDFYSRQEFERALSNPQILGQVFRLTEVKVFAKKNTNTDPGLNTINAIALLDLGVVYNGALDKYDFPNNDDDIYTDEELEALRPTESNATNEDFGASSQEYVNGIFEQLQENVDYTVDYSLGYISMKSFINSSDAIAVAYTFETSTGEIVQVGEIEPQNSSRTYLKLIRPAGMTTQDRAWPLTMRNIYSLGVQGITQDALTLNIFNTSNNLAEEYLPGRSETLLADLGLDRQNTDGALGADQQVDFNGLTLDANGRIMFPYLEPFGSRIVEILQNTNADDSTIASFAFNELYTSKAVDVRISSSKNGYYEISGTSNGGVSGSFVLAYGLVEGSVKVTASGVELTEGTDYEVDYSFGSLNILNERYLAAGQEINIEFESNQFAVIGQKNFTGIRAEYTVNEDIKIGSTYFRLKEQPLSDKIRIGNEPINNTVLGLDAKANFQTPWLTRFIDKIPLLQTKAASNINFSSEFAQLRPSVAQTNAVQSAINKGVLYSDEENGLVFIDDFEGAEYSISFSNPTRWNLAAAPAAVPGLNEDTDYFTGLVESTNSDFRKQRADLRSQFSWYTIPRNLSSVRAADITAETELIRLTDIYQGRVLAANDINEIRPLDVYYDPTNRGQYNYNLDLKNLLELSPERTWGGMTAVIPTGQEDLVQNNIEFLEFWVQAVLPDGEDPTGLEDDYKGKIYLDLGTISEDIVPNTQLNTEGGFSTIIGNLKEDDPFGTPRSYITAASNPPPVTQFSTDKRDQEDIGLDGAPNPGTPGAEGRDEGTLFEDFIAVMRQSYGEGSPEFLAIEADPSNDDYIYYGEAKVQNEQLNKRFFRLLGYHDGNSPESGNVAGKTAISLKPDSEGLVSPLALSQTNAYYQYELDFNPADLNQLEVGVKPYIVDKIENSPYYRSWYLVRIPLTDYTRKYGEIESFQNISHMRLWLSGYKRPFTLRFATFEFVGSQWKKLTNLSETPVSLDGFEISTINIEENAQRTPFPYRQPVGSIRAINRGAQVQTVQNEQSMVLSVEALGSGEMHMIKKVFNGGLNLLNYSNMRMFVHGEGFDNRGDAELVIRMGSDLENNYYEYRQPVSPTEPREFNFDIKNTAQLDAEAEYIWIYEENSVNIIVSALNVLKQRRDSDGFLDNEVYERSDILLGDNVPEGVVLAMRGTPSLDNVSEIGLGIRNPYDPSDVNSPGIPSLDAEFWVNELRVSGFDNEKGWAANAKSSIKFADFATLNANMTRRTNGFGGLNSRYDDRSITEQLAFNISSTINLHKLVPDRFGWNFPVTLTTTRDVRTPKYLPDQGDVRLTDFRAAVESDQNLNPKQQQDSIKARINETQTISEKFSVNFSDISKRNSKSSLARYTIDNLRLTYLYNTESAQDPRLIFQDRWNYNTTLSYNLALRRVKLLTPFGFTKNIPLVNALSGLRVGYLPNSIAMSTGISRNYSEGRNRNLTNPAELQALKQSHNFTQRSSFRLNYNFTQSIPISFQTNTNFDLAEAGIESRNLTGVDSLSYNPVPTIDVIRGIISDSISARRSSYQESYTASWRPALNRINSLNWLSYSLSYGGGFQWNNSPRGSNLGAQVGNSLNLDNSLKIDVKNIFDRLGFYGKMQDANKAETNERQSAKKARRQEIEDDVPDSLRSPRPAPNIMNDLKYLGRKVFLSTFSMREISTAYKRTKSSSQPGYLGDSQVYYMFNSGGSDKYSPPFSYRVGFADRIPQEQLIDNQNGEREVVLKANNTINDNFSAGTRITPFETLTIDLSWDLAISNRESDDITVTPEGTFSSNVKASGSYSSSVWAFGQGYSDLFKRQLGAAFNDIVDGSTVISDTTGNRDGRQVLNRNTMEEDFRRAYLGGNVSAIGSKGLLTIPRPSWRINWNRFERYIPFVGKYMQSATLSHSYRGSYRVDWQLNNSLTGLQDEQVLGSAFKIQDYRYSYEPTSLRAEQRFSPLLKLSVTWKSALRTELGYERSNISTFAISSKRVTEILSQGIDFSMNYVFQNVKLKLFPKLKNNIDLSIRGSYKNDDDIKYTLSDDLAAALVPGSSPVSNVNDATIQSAHATNSRRITGSISLGYKISTTIASNFEYTFTRRESNSIPTQINHDIRFNVRIAIRSN